MRVTRCCPLAGEQHCCEVYLPPTPQLPPPAVGGGSEDDALGDADRENGKGGGGAYARAALTTRHPLGPMLPLSSPKSREMDGKGEGGGEGGSGGGIDNDGSSLSSSSWSPPLPYLLDLQHQGRREGRGRKISPPT